MSLKSLGAGLAALMTLGTGAASADDGAGWSGIYAGLEGGYQSSNVGVNWSTESITPSDMDDVGGMTGGIVTGVNFETSGGFVVGAETDLLMHDLSGQIVTNPPDDGFSIASDLLWSLSARAGYAINDDLLLFMKAGYSGMDYETGAKSLGIPANDSGWMNGFHVGGGLEFRISERLSAKAEYRYVNFESLSVNSPSLVPVSLDPDIHLLLIGVNLHLP